MNTLDFIVDKFNLDLKQESPIEIPDFGRKQLAELLNKLSFSTGVEIGVAQGIYSEVLVKANPQMKLYGVDPYAPYRWYRDYTRSSTIGRLRQDAHERLDKYPNYEFIEAFSEEAVKRFDNDSLDFVYIDGNHEYSFVATDISIWTRKVRPGGIVAGHDYVRRKEPTQTHVIQALKGYVDAYHIKPWFVLGAEPNDQGLIRDNPRSWMFIK